MDQAGYVRPALRLDRQDIAAVALGDDGVLQVLRVVAAKERVQFLTHSVGEQAQVTPDVVELRAGAVRDLILGQDGVEDGLLKFPVGVQVRRQLRDQRRVLPVGDDGGAHHARGLERFGHVEERSH